MQPRSCSPGPAPRRRGSRAGAWLGLRAAAGLLLLCGSNAFPHEGPEHEIDELTALIQQHGETADRLLQRAIEYAVLGKNSDALRDLERATRLDPGSFHILRELARAQARAGRTDDALATLGRALRLPTEDAVDRSGILMLRAEIHRSKDRLAVALADCNAAIALHPSNPEWYLLRSDLQRRLGNHRERIQHLRDGIQQTGSGLLDIELTEALLDDKQYEAALQRIEPELRSRRVRHAWLVRQGRAEIGLGRTPEGERALQTALTEIDTLLDPARPEPGLLLEKATAHALLGNREVVRACARLAKAKRLDPAVIDRIQDLLTASRKRSNARRESTPADDDESDTQPLVRPDDAP